MVSMKLRLKLQLIKITGILLYVLIMSSEKIGDINETMSHETMFSSARQIVDKKFESALDLDTESFGWIILKIL